MEIDGHEYACREIPTESFPSRVGVRRNVGFNAAIRRLSAAETWTEILTAQVELGGSLVALAESARRRLNPHDNARRREEWTAQVDEAKLKVALVKPDPPPLDPGLPSSHAKADAAGHIPYTPEYFAAVGMLLVRALLELGQTAPPEWVFTDAADAPKRIGDSNIPVVRVQSGEDIVATLRKASSRLRAMPDAALFASADRKACQAVLEALPEFDVRLLHDPQRLEDELIHSWAIRALV